MEQNVSFWKPGEHSLCLTAKFPTVSIPQTHHSLSPQHHSSGLQDRSEDVVLILGLQCFAVLSPSGSDSILLQDYSDSSMQICFIY